MHVHLMMALTLRFILLIVITEPFVFERENHYRNVVSNSFIGTHFLRNWILQLCQVKFIGNHAMGMFLF